MPFLIFVVVTIIIILLFAIHLAKGVKNGTSHTYVIAVAITADVVARFHQDADPLCDGDSCKSVTTIFTLSKFICNKKEIQTFYPTRCSLPIGQTRLPYNIKMPAS